MKTKMQVGGPRTAFIDSESCFSISSKGFPIIASVLVNVINTKFEPGDPVRTVCWSRGPYACTSMAIYAVVAPTVGSAREREGTQANALADCPTTQCDETT